MIGDIKTQIRKANIEHSNEVDNLRITSHQRKVYHLVEKGFCTSALLAKEINISVHSATATLKKLYDKGYIERVAESDTTGGIVYIYYSAIDD